MYFIFLPLFYLFHLPITPPMQLTFTNIQQPYGTICFAIYQKPSGFMDTRQALYTGEIPVAKNNGATISVQLDLPNGTYAISAIHDLNGNKKLDTNFLGIPMEPYGFSNRARPKFRAPYWEEAKVIYTGQPLEIRLEKR